MLVSKTFSAYCKKNIEILNIILICHMKKKYMNPPMNFNNMTE